MDDPDKTQDLPSCAPERQEGWGQTPTNPKVPPPPRRYRKNEDPLTRPALRERETYGDVEVSEPGEDGEKGFALGMVVAVAGVAVLLLLKSDFMGVL